MIAAGSYLWTLREMQGLSRDEVAYKAGTNAVQVMRIEKGEIDTRSSLLASIVWVVKGSADQVMELIRDEAATLETGKELAYKWLSARDIAELDAIPLDQRGEALLILDEIERRDTETFQAAIRLLKALVGR